MVTFPRTTRLVRARVDEFLFSPGSAANLGFLRILFYGYMLIQFAGYQSWPWADVSTLFWTDWSSIDLLGLPLLPQPVLYCLDVVWKLSLLAACLGLFTRWTTKSSFLLGVYLLGIPQNYCKISHLVGLLVLTMLVLAASRCGDALSVDAWLRGRTGRRPRSSGEYTWPIRLVWLLHAVAFFAAGWAKLVGEGWLLTDNLRYQFILHHYHDDRVLPAIGLYLAQSGTLCMLLALFTLAIELGAPLALFSTTARRVIVPSLLLLQIGNAWILGVHASLPWAVIYAFWVPWDSLTRRLASSRIMTAPAATPDTVAAADPTAP